MACSEYASHQAGRDENVAVEIVNFLKPIPVPKNVSTSFVLVDPSTSASKAGGKEARSTIRKHASKACAAQRLATIAEKKRAQNILSKRERQRQQAAERLDAALQQHARKFAPIKEEYPLVQLEYQTKESTSTVRAKELAVRDPHVIISRSDTPLNAHGKAKCSIPWLLAPLSPSTSADNSDLATATSNERRQLDEAQPRSPRTLEIYSKRVDGLAYTPLNLNLEVDDRVCFLMDSLFKTTYRLFDLRLPTKADKLLGRQNVWTTVFPQFVYTSEPLFWANVLGAGTIEALRLQQFPGLDPWTLRYRDLAISSVNRRLQTSEKDLVLDSGLISAIASLGVWERQCGSKDIWLAHCRGVETLSERLREQNQEQLLAALVSSCKVPDSEPWVDNHSKGFKRIRDRVLLDRNLVCSLCSLYGTAMIGLDGDRSHALQAEAVEIVKYSTVSTINSRLRFPEGERINLEMHVLIQGAGVSMINFMAGNSEVAAVAHIDVQEMCLEAVGLAKSIYSEPIYDEALLWAMFTMYALNNFTKSDGLDVLAGIVRRLQISSWPSLENLLHDFVCLAAATNAYLDTWTEIQVRLTPESDCAPIESLEQTKAAKEP